MPEPSGRGSREFLPSANQALADLEEATGKPVMVVEAPELNVLATIRKAGPEDASHLLRIQGSRDRQADYLTTDLAKEPIAYFFLFNGARDCLSIACHRPVHRCPVSNQPSRLYKS